MCYPACFRHKTILLFDATLYFRVGRNLFQEALPRDLVLCELASLVRTKNMSLVLYWLPNA
jgi:hypothetical protein